MKKVNNMLNEMSYQSLTNDDLKSRLQVLMKNAKVQQAVEKYQLSDDFLLKNLVSLQEFVSEDDIYNQTGSSQAVPGFRPVLVVHNNNLYVEYQKTKEKDILEAKQRKVFLDIPKSIKEASLKEIDKDVIQNNAELISAIYNYVKVLSVDHNHFEQGFYLWGDFGRGKTYLMGAIVNYLTDNGIQSIMMNTATFIADLKANFDNGNYVNEQIQHIQKVPFLVLDDLGAENMSSWARDDVLGVILQYRMQEELPTCFTSNLSLNQLEAHFAETRDSIDKIKAKRIMERIYYLAKDYQITGVNKRR